MTKDKIRYLQQDVCLSPGIFFCMQQFIKVLIVFVEQTKENMKFQDHEINTNLKHIVYGLNNV